MSEVYSNNTTTTTKRSITVKIKQNINVGVSFFFSKNDNQDKKNIFFVYFVFVHHSSHTNIKDTRKINFNLEKRRKKKI